MGSDEDIQNLMSGFIASDEWGWIKKIKLKSPDFGESPAEKSGRLTDDGENSFSYW